MHEFRLSQDHQIQYIAYKSFVVSLPRPLCLDVAVHVMHSPANKEAMAVAYPLISSILARIAVLPASSAQVERLFSAMKRVKSAQRNRLKAKTLDHLLRISIEGPAVQVWDPYPALRKWESMGNRRIQVSRQSHTHTRNGDNMDDIGLAKVYVHLLVTSLQAPA